MSLREAAQQALEALEDSHQNINPERRYADELTRQIADSITALRAALAEDAMQRLTDVQQEIDCYGDGNVYRGQRSSDSKVQTITFSKVETVEPVAWRVHPFDYGVGIEGAYAMTMRPDQAEAWKRKGWNIESLYTAPPKRKPLTDEKYNELLMAVGKKHPGETRHETALRYIRLAEMNKPTPARAIERKVRGEA